MKWGKGDPMGLGWAGELLIYVLNNVCIKLERKVIGVRKREKEWELFWEGRMVSAADVYIQDWRQTSYWCLDTIAWRRLVLGSYLLCQGLCNYPSPNANWMAKSISKIHEWWSCLYARIYLIPNCKWVTLPTIDWGVIFINGNRNWKWRRDGDH